MTDESRDAVRMELRGTALWVCLNRPEAFNALTPASIQGLVAAMDRVDADGSIRSLVVTGIGKAFCAGADLKAVLATGTGSDATQVTSAFLRQVGDAFDRLESLPIPTIAAVNGVALAGGLELMLCCDIAFSSASAKLGDGHANFGQIPGGGGTLRLPRRVGAARAKYLMFSGQSISAAKAEHWGLVDEVCEPDALSSRVGEVAEQLRCKSSLVLARMKVLVNDAADRSGPAALEAELLMSDRHMTAHDRNEGLAAFTEKRNPVYIGR